jgi:4-hydroxybutyrate CoA-transferase
MKTISHLRDILAQLPPQPTIVLHSGFAEPALLAQQLADMASDISGAKVYVFMPMGEAPYASLQATQHLRVEAFFPGKALRQPIAQGLVQPNFTRFSQVPEQFNSGRIQADLLLLQVSTAGPEGLHSLGISLDYMAAVLAQQPMIVAEINAQMPRTHSPVQLPSDAITAAIEVNVPLHEAAPAQGDQLELDIAQHIAGLVRSGDVLQLGIGALPDMVLAQLGHLRHLGLHSGIVTDAVRPLIESGVIDNSTKREHAGKCITTMAGGTADFYRYLDGHPLFEFHPCNHTHAQATLSRIEGLCCINSVLQVDLNGNANAQTMGGRLIATPGGLLDFAQGASRAPRGKSIIALRSANRDATVSNIVAAFDPNTPRSLTAGDLDYIVTEYGVAAVRGVSPAQLKRNLGAIAHPNFRDLLS